MTTNKKPAINKKTSLYDKPVEMVPKISIFGKKLVMRSGVEFWPQEKEKTDDDVPKPK